MLIDCPECGGKVSEHARTCPHCGYQIASTLGGHVESGLQRMKSFFAVRQNLIGFMILLGGAIPQFFLEWDGDYGSMTSIVLAHLIPVGLLLMIPHWKKLALIPLLVLTLADLSFWAWVIVRNCSNNRINLPFGIAMAVWFVLVLSNVTFLVVKIRAKTDNYARRALVALGKTILAVFLICVMSSICDIIYEFLYELFDPMPLKGNFMLSRGDVMLWVANAKMRNIRAMGCMMIIFPLLFCLPILKLAYWAWGRATGRVLRWLAIANLVFMMASHAIRSVGSLRECAVGNDWTILVFMAISTLIFMILSSRIDRNFKQQDC